MAEVFDKVKITVDDLGSDPAPQPESAVKSATTAVEGDLETALAEFMELGHVFEEAGFVVSCLEAEIGARPRLIPHFRLVHDTGQAAQQRLLERHADKPLAAMVLEALIQAQELARKMPLDKLQFAEVVIELTTPPTVRVAWREEVAVKAGAAKAVRVKDVARKISKAASTEPVTAKVVGSAPAKEVRAVTAKRAKSAGS